MKRKIKHKGKTLSHETEIKVRFSEVDSMAITWHGSYVKFLEDARESFGEKYNLGYLDVYEKGFVIPLVNINIDYKKPLIYGDKAIVKITFVDNDAAKLYFEYEIRNKANNELVATAETTQIFMNTDKELVFYSPDFFIEWKEQYLI